jgi:hypothetical protein
MERTQSVLFQVQPELRRQCIRSGSVPHAYHQGSVP